MLSLIENLKEHLPFSLLSLSQLREIESSSQIAYYKFGSKLITSNQLPQYIFMIIKGSVEAREDEVLIDVYHEDDSFGGIEIIERRVSSYSYSVTEELICYEIPTEIFLTLCKKNQEFKTYFFSTIIERMEMLKAKKEHSSVADMMVARIDSSILHKGCLLEAETPIIEALSQMEESGAVAIIVKNSEGYGIVTDADFRGYILRQQVDNLQTISQIQTTPIISVKEDELMFNVLLLMTQHSIKHLPIFNEERLIGVLELVDLLSFFSNQSHLITVQMDRAEDLESVIGAGQKVWLMVSALHAKGVKSRYIAKLVAEIKKKMYAKLFSLIFPKDWHNNCALLLLGSEGREEQILRTDQDNALVFAEDFIPDEIESVTLAFIQALDAIGFPRCEGGIMVINPHWCKGIGAYKKDIQQWIVNPSYKGFMDMAIFVDSMVVAGDRALHQELQEYLFVEVSNHKSVLIHFAKSIESFESPLGLFSRFVSGDKGHKNEIDIKKGALFALVHGVRALALEYGIRETNTTLRIKALNDRGYMNKEDARDMLEALEAINTLRLHTQLQKLESGGVMDNYISIANMSKLEKDLLKEALKTVEKFKKQVVYHFHLSSVG